MKQRLTKRISNALISALAVIFIGLIPANNVFAADNAATGGIGGVNNGTLTNGDGTNTALFSLVSRTLTLYKTAYLADGTALTSGARLPANTVVHFLIYVNNDTSVQISDIRMSDTLNALFGYTVGSDLIKYGTTTACTNGGANDGTCSVTEVKALRDAAVAGTATTDTVGSGDYIGASGATVLVEVGLPNNTQLDVTANQAWGVLIPVTIQ